MGSVVATPAGNDGRTVAVWSPSDPVAGAALGANLAAVPGAPALVVDSDVDWADTSSILLDESPALAECRDLLSHVTEGARGIRVAACQPDPEIVDALRDAGGGIVVLPDQLSASRLAAAADLLVLCVVRSFPSLRRARLALDALPPARGDVLLVLAEGPPSDISAADVERVLGLRATCELPPGGREMAACLERGELPAASPHGGWARGVAELATHLWPGCGEFGVVRRGGLARLRRQW